jgi:hypothetical protein
MNTMKSLFLLFGIILFFVNSKAQLKVNAGNDTILCCCAFNDENELITLGGNPVASGGIEPYTYTWSGKQLVDTLFNIWIYASDILDDTTKGNPVFQKGYAPEKWFTYYLMVEDATGDIQYDSVKIILSIFWIQAIYMLPDTIYRGDSVPLIGDPYFVNNFPPFEYTISPSHGLSDTTDIYGWAKPDTSITYYLQAVNSVGCISPKIEYWHIEVVDTTTYSNNEVGNAEAQCYFSNGILIIHVPSFKNSPFQLTVTTVDGRIIHSGKYNSHPLRLPDLGLKPRQLYLVSIRNERKKSVCKLFF